MVLDFADAHPAAIQTKAKITRLGPVVEEFGVSGPDARQRLGTGGSPALTAVASLGGMTDRTEARHMLERTLEAWNIHARPDDRLFILAAETDLAEVGARHPGVEWVGFTRHPEVYYAAADVVITDALGFTNCELAFNRIPALAFLVQAVVDEYAESFSRRIELLSSSGAITIVNDTAGHDLIWQAMDGFRSPGLPASNAHCDFPWAHPRNVAELILRHLPG